MSIYTSDHRQSSVKIPARYVDTPLVMPPVPPIPGSPLFNTLPPGFKPTKPKPLVKIGTLIIRPYINHWCIQNIIGDREPQTEAQDRFEKLIFEYMWDIKMAKEMNEESEPV